MKITATDHAVQRYQERVRPSLSPEAARGDLERLLRLHAEPCERPEWYVERRTGPPTTATHWARIGDVFLACVQPRPGRLLVLTVITHGLSPEARAKRSGERRAARRAARLARRTGQSASAIIARERDAA